MKTQEAISHFGDVKALAEAMDCWPHVIYRWGAFPPRARQYEIQVKSGGALIAESEKRAEPEAPAKEEEESNEEY